MNVKREYHECRMKTRYGEYILKSDDKRIKQIYNSNGEVVFKASEKQYITLVVYTWLDEKVIGNDKPVHLMINVFEDGKNTILYDLNKRKEIAKSVYIESFFSYYHGWVIENNDYQVKAIYDLDGSVLLKTMKEDCKFVFDEENECINEIFNDGKCHQIYIKTKSKSRENTVFKSLFYNLLYDLSLIRKPTILEVGEICNKSILVGTYKDENYILRIV